jgi:hypothetical protein
MADITRTITLTFPDAHKLEILDALSWYYKWDGTGSQQEFVLGQITSRLRDELRSAFRQYKQNIADTAGDGNIGVE